MTHACAHAHDFWAHVVHLVQLCKHLYTC